MDTPTPSLIAITGGNLSGRRGPQFSAVGTVRNAKSIRILMIHLPTHYPPRARTQKLSPQSLKHALFELSIWIPCGWYYRHLSTIYIYIYIYMGISWYIMLLSGTSSWTWSVIWRRDGARGISRCALANLTPKWQNRELSVSLRPLTCKACPDNVKKPGATPPSACKPLPLKIYWLSWC